MKRYNTKTRKWEESLNSKESEELYSQIINLPKPNHSGLTYGEVTFLHDDAIWLSTNFGESNFVYKIIGLNGNTIQVERNVDNRPIICSKAEIGLESWNLKNLTTKLETERECIKVTGVKAEDFDYDEHAEPSEAKVVHMFTNGR